MIVAFANNQVQCLKDSTQTDITFLAQGSNDGQNWFDLLITGSTGAITTSPVTSSDDVACSFIRFEFSLINPGGSGSDISAVCYDLHANLITK